MTIMMRSLFVAASVLAMSALSAAAQTAAPAPAAPVLNTAVPVAAGGDATRNAIRQAFAVVDVQFIMRESKAAKSVQAQIESQQKKYQEQINAEESGLRTAQDQLQRQQAALAPEAYAQKRKEFETRVGQVQQSVQSKKRDLEAAFAQGSKRIQDQVIAIVSKIAEERKLVAVFPRSQVLLVESQLDLTKQVMEKLNAQLPNVQVSIPGASRAAANGR